MSLSYIEDGDSTYIEGEPCPTCRSTATLKEVGYGFWKCEDCSTVWGYDKDDPDYDEAEALCNCGQPATKLCDGKTATGTCDRPLCPSCVGYSSFFIACTRGKGGSSLRGTIDYCLECAQRAGKSVRVKEGDRP